MFYAMLLVGCSGSTVYGSEALGQVDAIRVLVDAHAAEVNSATTLEEITQMEVDHTTAMGDATAEMTRMMSTMMGCDMGGMMESMTDADAHREDMMEVVSAHADAQAAHTDVAACQAEEGVYTSAMNDHLDAMSTDMMGFDDEADCTSSSGMM